MSLFILPSLVSGSTYIPPDFYNDNSFGNYKFFQNLGQCIDVNGNARPDIWFYSYGPAPSIYTREWNTVSFVLSSLALDSISPDTVTRIDLTHVGEGISHVEAVGIGEVPEKFGYYLPHVPNGVNGVSGYERIVYENMYDGIDLHVTSSAAGPKFYYVIRPGADPSELQLQFSGHDSLVVDIWGDLKIYFKQKYLRLQEAVAYQDNNGQIQSVSWGAEYLELNGIDQVGFYFGSYDTTLPLILQIGFPPAPPTNPNLLCWSTYYGGEGSDNVEGSDVDEDGNYYITGHSTSGLSDFPILGTNVIVNLLTQRMFVSRFDSNHDLEWSIFYGGTDDQSGMDIAAKNSEQIFLVGYTAANDLQTFGPYWVDDVNNSLNTEGVIAELDEFGNMVWSTYFGGVGADRITGAAIDSEGRLVVTGFADDDLELVTRSGAMNNPFGSGLDAFIAMFDPSDDGNDNNDVLWCTYLGGDGLDRGYDLETDIHGNFFVLGSTTSSDLHTENNYQGANTYFEDAPFGGQDLFIAEFDIDGVDQWITYFGGSGYDVPGENGIAINKDGNLIVVGSTSSSDLVLEQGPGWWDWTFAGSDGLIAEFESTNRERVWCTYVSGNGETWFQAVTHDARDNIYVTGGTRDALFHLKELQGQYYQDDIRGTWGDLGSECVIMSFTDDKYLAWSTLFGGEGTTAGEKAWTIEWDNELVYCAGSTSIDPFIPTPIDFPRKDPGSPAYFDGSYNSVDPAGIRDGFITAFCTAVLTDVDDQPRSDGLLNAYTADNMLYMVNPEEPVIDLRIIDLRGRSTIAPTPIPGARSMQAISLEGLASGMYVLRVRTTSRDLSFKFVIN